MVWWVQLLLGAVVLSQLVWVFRQAPTGMPTLLEILALSSDELATKISGYGRFVRVLAIVSSFILAGCGMALFANLGLIAYIATAVVLAILTKLFIEVCSDVKLLKLERCRRGLQD
jgi:hypothetical protein